MWDLGPQENAKHSPRRWRLMQLYSQILETTAMQNHDHFHTTILPIAYETWCVPVGAADTESCTGKLLATCPEMLETQKPEGSTQT